MSHSIRDAVIPPNEVPASVKSNQIGMYLNVVLSALVVYDSRTCSAKLCFRTISFYISLHTWQGGTEIWPLRMYVLMWDWQVKYFWASLWDRLIAGDADSDLSAGREQTQIDKDYFLPRTCIHQVHLNCPISDISRIVTWAYLVLLLESYVGLFCYPLIQATDFVFSWGDAPNPDLVQCVDYVYHNQSLRSL